MHCANLRARDTRAIIINRVQLCEIVCFDRFRSHQRNPMGIANLQSSDKLRRVPRAHIVLHFRLAVGCVECVTETAIMRYRIDSRARCLSMCAHRGFKNGALFKRENPSFTLFSYPPSVLFREALGHRKPQTNCVWLA